MIKSKVEVKRQAGKLGVKCGWLGYAIGVITATVVFVFNPPLWVLILMALVAGLGWSWLEKRIIGDHVEGMYEAE